MVPVSSAAQKSGATSAGIKTRFFVLATSLNLAPLSPQALHGRVR